MDPGVGSGTAVRTINVGLLGYGLAGKTFHARVIGALPGFALRAVATSRTEEVAHDLPATRAVASPDDVFADPAIELVVIATPNATHFELAQRALEAGKHVVVDKPIATTRAHADALVALAAQTGRLLSVYHNRRYDDDYLTVKALLDAGRLGTVYAYEEHFDRFRPAIKPGWRERPQPGSGALFDLGSHLIDHVLQLFGIPETVTADTIAQRPHARVDDYFHIVFGYRERRAIVHASALVREPGPRIAVHGDGGSYLSYGIDPQEAELKAGVAARVVRAGDIDPGRSARFVDAGGNREALAMRRGSYTSFYAALAAALAGEGPVPVSAESARDVVALIELAQRSAAERRTLTV